MAIIGGFVGGALRRSVWSSPSAAPELYLWMVAMTIGVIAGATGTKGVGMAAQDVWAVSPSSNVGGRSGIHAAHLSPSLPRRVLRPHATVGEDSPFYSVPSVWGIVVTVAGLPREVALERSSSFSWRAGVVFAGCRRHPRRWAESDVTAGAAATR